MTAALHEQPARQAIVASTLPVLAALLLLWHAPLQAGQGTGQFPVAINLQGAPAPVAAPASILCRSNAMVGTFGSSVTVVCTTGVAALAAVSPGTGKLPWTPMPDNTYRFMLSSYANGGQYHAVDDYFGAGTVATWRMIKLNDRDYLEMMLHW